MFWAKQCPLPILHFPTFACIPSLSLEARFMAHSFFFVIETIKYLLFWQSLLVTKQGRTTVTRFQRQGANEGELVLDGVAVFFALFVC